MPPPQSPPHLPRQRANPRRTAARLIISFVIAALVTVPVISNGLVDAAIIFVLALGVSYGALLLITNP